MATPAGSGGAGSIVNIVDLVVRARNVDAVGQMTASFSRLRRGFTEFGVTTIFLDRLMQSFSRAWTAVGKVINVADFTERASKINKMAAGLGMQNDQLSAFVGLSERYGAEINDIPDLIATMQDKLMEFADGNKTVVDNLKGSKLVPEDFVGKGPLDRFLTLVDGLKELDEQTRSAILSRFFGDDLGRKFAPMIAKGSKAIRAEMVQLLRTGQVMSKAQIEMGESTRTALNTLWGVFSGFQNNMTQSVLPTIKQAAEEATTFMVGLATTASQHVEEMSGMFKRFYDFVKDRTVFRALRLDAEATFGAIQAGFLGLLAIGSVYLAPLIYSASTFLGVLALIGLAMQDLYVYMQGGDSLIGQFLGSAKGTEVAGPWSEFFERLPIQIEEIQMVLLGLLSEIAGSPVMEALFIGLPYLLDWALTFIKYFFVVISYGLGFVNRGIEFIIGLLSTLFGWLYRIIGMVTWLFNADLGNMLMRMGSEGIAEGDRRFYSAFSDKSAMERTWGFAPAAQPVSQNNIVVNNTVNSVNAPQTAVAVLNDSMTKVGDKVRQ